VEWLAVREAGGSGPRLSAPPWPQIWANPRLSNRLG